MPDAANPFIAFFLMMVRRQMQFLLVIGAATVLFAFFSYGISIITFWIVLTTAMVLGMFFALTWFWRGVFRSMLDRSS